MPLSGMLVPEEGEDRNARLNNVDSLVRPINGALRNERNENSSTNSRASNRSKKDGKVEAGYLDEVAVKSDVIISAVSQSVNSQNLSLNPVNASVGAPVLESLDFDNINNPYWVDEARRPERTILGYTGKSFARWTLTIFIGVGVAFVARFLQYMISTVSGIRNSVLQSYFDEQLPDSHAFAFFVTYNLALVLCGTLMTVYLEPSAAAGGIPEIKAYLNGTHVRNFLRLRAVLVKIFGTILSVSSGLAAGQEGPMIHIGAGIASGVTRGEKLYRKLFCFRLPRPRRVRSSIFRRFHNDRDRREFICAGACAGMAAAFGAPVGGVLFALEEAASHWSPQLIWRIFTAALVATFTLAFIKARTLPQSSALRTASLQAALRVSRTDFGGGLQAGENSGDISLAGLLSFGTVQSVGDMKREIINDDGTVNVRSPPPRRLTRC